MGKEMWGTLCISQEGTNEKDDGGIQTKKRVTGSTKDFKLGKE